MDPIFNDYLLYYEARMKRRQNSTDYANSYQSEKAMYELLASCNSMEEMQGKADQMKALSLQNAIALIKDQELIRKKIYEDCKEYIRAKAPQSILEQASACTTDLELIEMVNRVQQKVSIEITVDQLADGFYGDFTALENIEVYQQSTIPEEWKETCNGYAQAAMERGKKNWLENELPNARNWQPGWTMEYDLLKEDRHRRLIPVNDEELEKKINLHKQYKPC
jgi:hypothetical protein